MFHRTVPISRTHEVVVVAAEEDEPAPAPVSDSMVNGPTCE